MKGLLFALLFAIASPARADSTADEADFRFHRGTSLYKQGRIEEALGEFLASNRLVRNRNVVFNVARCFEELKKLNEAYRWYSDILREEMPEADRAELAAALKRLQPSLALVRVVSDPPGATVYLDRKDLGARGQTPVSLALKPGVATVLVELDGYSPRGDEVKLAVGKTALLQLRLDRLYGAIAAEGEPRDFELRVDGEEGAPLLTRPGEGRVVPGRHILTLSAPGHVSQQIAVEVPQGSVTPVRFTLARLPPPSGALVVRANVDGALIRVDGKEMGFTPGVIDVAAGPHQLEIAGEGREPVREKLEIRANERRFVEVKLPWLFPRVVAAEKTLTRVQDAPASISVISAEEIRGFGYTTLGEALRSVRGLYTTYGRDYETVGVRGFSTPGIYNSRVLVLSDGHVTNESSLGQGYVGHDFDADLSDVERIEVVRGPGSVLYGSAAFSAVVNVVHVTPATGAHASLGGHIGTLGENAGHLSASLADETSWVWARVSGLDMAGDPIFADPRDPTRTALNLDGERAAHGDFRARAGELTLLASYNTRRKTLPTASFDTVFGAPGTVLRDERGFLEAQLAHVFPSGLALEARASYDGERYRGTWQYQGRAAGLLGSDTSREDWVTAELRLRLPELAGHRLFAGAEVQDRFNVLITADVPADTSGLGALHFDNASGNPSRAPRSELVLSAYAGDDFRISKRLLLDAAVRVDKFQDAFPPGSDEQSPAPIVNPRLALIANPYEGSTSKLMLGAAYRYPGFYERYFNDGGASQLAADHLRAERVLTAELEHTHAFSDETQLLVTAYLSELQHLIRVGAVGDKSQYQNRAFATHAVGAEAELRWSAGPGAIFSAWYAWSLLRSDGDEATGESRGWFRGSVLPNSPEHSAALRVLYPLLPQTLSVSTALGYRGPRHSFSAPGERDAILGESLDWSVGLSGEYRKVRYGAFVDDLLDQRPSLPGGPEIPFPNHAVAQYGRTLRLTASASF